MPVIPSSDINKSLRFWVDGLGFTADRHMEIDGKLVGCMLPLLSMHEAKSKRCLKILAAITLWTS